MASGVLLDTYDDDLEPSSPIVSSDSDSANTASSRVYFGPVQSAEKRHIRPRESGHRTPIRRSTRRSAGLSLEPVQTSTDGEVEDNVGSSNEGLVSDQSRPDTPMILEDALEGESTSHGASCELKRALQNRRLLWLQRSSEHGTTLHRHLVPQYRPELSGMMRTYSSSTLIVQLRRLC